MKKSNNLTSMITFLPLYSLILYDKKFFLKKIVSILLFVVVAYYSGGYYLHFLAKQELVKEELYSNVSASVPFEGTLEFSVPIPFYGTVDREYEAKQGEFFFKGKYYNVLGSKIENNTLIISCVANPKTKLLHEELFGFIEDNILGNSASDSNQKNKTLKVFLPEFASFSKKQTIYIFEWLTKKAENQFNFQYSTRGIKVNSPPPQFS
jgi:hypothetical protein